MDAVHRDLVPSGTLRAAVSYGNSVLVQRDASSGELSGLAVDLFDELARRLSARRSVIAYEGAVNVLEAGLQGAWDLAILAVDRERSERLDFTPPLFVLEGTCLIRAQSPFRTMLDLDRDGIRIAVVHDTVYDRHLTGCLRHAEVTRWPTFREAIERFLAEPLEAVAGLKQPLETFARSDAGLTIIEGRFSAIEPAIAVPKGRSAALRYLTAFVAEMKSSRRIADALQRASTV